LFLERIVLSLTVDLVTGCFEMIWEKAFDLESMVVPVFPRISICFDGDFLLRGNVFGRKEYTVMNDVASLGDPQRGETLEDVHGVFPSPDLYIHHDVIDHTLCLYILPDCTHL
jgi:hypothetical protein